MVYPPVQGDKTTSFSEWIISCKGGQLWYNFIIPPLSVQILLLEKYFMLKLAFCGKRCSIKNTISHERVASSFILYNLAHKFNGNKKKQDTVDLQWLEHKWLVYHGCFELVLESPGKNPIAAHLEKFRVIFLFYIENSMLCVLIRIASMR